VSWHPLPFAVSPEGGKDKARISVSDPVATKEVQCGLGQRHIAILGPFSTVHVDHHARAVDIGDFQVKTFVESEATGVYGREIGVVLKGADTSEESLDLFAA
jgi:hypothetical protein